MHFGFKSKIVLPAIGLIMLRSNTNTTTNTNTIRVTIRHNFTKISNLVKILSSPVKQQNILLNMDKLPPITPESDNNSKPLTR